MGVVVRDFRPEVQQLLDDLDRDFPKTVILDEENPKFVGVFKRVEFGPSQFRDELVPIVVMKDQEGNEHGLWLNNAVLISQFKRNRPKVGELVGIAYMGKRESKNSPQPYKDYKVRIQRSDDGQAFDWNDVFGERKIAPPEDDRAEDLAPVKPSRSFPTAPPEPLEPPETGSW